ncbi:MAG TPA: putative quinol monooxygenase [Gemmataceae bacterium]|jgi:quinol monooxygenase YgiN
MRAALCLAALMVVAAPVWAADPPTGDLVARAKAAAGDKPFGMIVRIKVKPDGVKRFEAAAERSVAATRKEKGNVGYELHRDLEDAGVYYFIEKWQSPAALAEHLKADYVRNLLETAGEVADGPPDIRFTAAAGK